MCFGVVYRVLSIDGWTWSAAVAQRAATGPQQLTGSLHKAMRIIQLHGGICPHWLRASSSRLPQMQHLCTLCLSIGLRFGAAAAGRHDHCLAINYCQQPPGSAYGCIHPEDHSRLLFSSWYMSRHLMATRRAALGFLESIIAPHQACLMGDIGIVASALLNTACKRD